MAEEVSPESKVYVKEEIEKIRKEFKEEVEKAKSKATKTLSTVAIVVGLLTGLSVYNGAQTYIDTAISKGLEEKGITDLVADVNNYVEQTEGLVADANNSYNSIVEWEDKSKKLVEAMDGNRIITLEKKLEKLENHTHTIVLNKEEKSTRYITGTGYDTNTRGSGRKNIPEEYRPKQTGQTAAHVITGVYNDSGGHIFYYNKLLIK